MISDNCSNAMLRRCIFSQIEYGLFLPPTDLDRFQARILAEPDELDPHLLDDVGALAAEEVQPGLYRIEGLLLQLGEGKVLQFRLDRIHADALGQGRVDLHRLLGDALPAIHGVTKCRVRMLCSRSASFTSSTRMSWLIASTSLRKFSACLSRPVFSSSFVSFVTPSTNPAIGLPNRAAISAQFDAGIFDRVVQQRGHDAARVQPVSRQDVGDGNGMGDVGVAIVAPLVAMRLHGHDVGGVDKAGISLRIVRKNALRQFELTDDAGAVG